MDLAYLPGRCKRIRDTVAILLFFFVLLTSIFTATSLPQKLSGEGNSTTRRWAIDDCFTSRNGFYDVTFVMDVATNRETLRNVQRFINDVTRRLKHTESGAKIGFMTFSNRVQSVVYKKRWRHQAELRDAIFALKPIAQFRRSVGKSITAVAQFINPKSVTRSIVILLVGGRSFDSVIRPSKILHKRNARTIVIGYSHANGTQLRWAASKPYKENLLLFDSSEDIVMATEMVLSIICEEIMNGRVAMQTRYHLKKSSMKGKPVRSLGQHTVVSSAESITIRWGGNPSPQVMNYKITWVPRDGNIELHVNTTVSKMTLMKLHPATIYKIRISPTAKKSYGRPMTIVAATAPLPVTNLTAKVDRVEPCSLQKHLQLKMDPKASRLVRISRRSTRQVMTNVKPGAHYTVSVVSRGPRLHQSRAENVTVVIPPDDPIRLHTVVINSTAVALRWMVPRGALFDSFVIDVVSAFGKKVYRLEVPEEPVDIPVGQPRPFYTFVIGDLRPDTDYRVTVFTESLHVPSRGDKIEQFSTKFKSDMYNEPFLIISGGDGIYAATARKGPMGTEKVQKLFSVNGGVVNSVYHSKWIRPRPYIHSSENPYQWQKLLIWIERYTRDIKVTDLTSQSRTATLVTGLLQPVALLIDPYGENIYWSDIGSRSIGVASISGEPGSKPYQVNRKLVTGDLVSPVSLALDIVERYIFFGDLKGHIERANMDGSQRKVLMKSPSLRPYSMTYCTESKRLYWIDASTGNLESMMSSGDDYKIVYEKATVPMISASTLVIADGDFYWYDVKNKSIDMLKKMNDSEEYEHLTSVYPESSVPLVTSMTTYDTVAIEKALMTGSLDLTFPCSSYSSSCTGVCIPVTMKNSTCSNDCHPWEMLCYRSKNLECIDQHFTCNGIIDCENGEDEDLPQCEAKLEEGLCQHENLSAYGCHDTGRCIPYESVCNGYLDCLDGSEEKNCPVQAQSCDFETEGFCLWTQNKDSDDFDWMLHYGRTASNETGPLMDHTMIKLNGSYIYLEATSMDEGNKARLNSVLFAKPVCISFYYYMHGATMGTVSLIMRDYKSGEERVLWSRSGDQGNDWNLATVSVDKHQLYQLIIEGVRGEDYRSDIAIDDITIQDGLCHVSNECTFNNFDDLMCGYKLGSYWKQVFGPVAAPGSSPETKITRKPEILDLSNIIGPEWFYFDFKSDDFPGCSECQGTRLVRDISMLEYAEDGINYAGVVLCDTKRYKIYLSETLAGPFRNIADGAGKGEDHCEFIGLSDYANSTGKYKECEGDIGYVRRRWGEKLQIESFGFYRSIYFAAASYDCGFEFPQSVVDNDPKQWLRLLPNSYLHLDLLAMKPSSQKSDDFKIRVALVPQDEEIAEEEIKTPKKNPQRMFSFSGISSPAHNVNFTEIKSELRHPPSWCLKFRYFMIGSDVKSLQIMVNEHTIWVKNKQEDSEWSNATVVIPYPSVKYDLTISAVRGRGFEGSIGIDHVTILHEPCYPKVQYKCNFNVPMEEECSFTTVGGKPKQILLDPLYKRSRFDPDIIAGHPHRGGVITASKIKLSNGTQITTNPVLRSPVLPSLSRFYPVLCLTVNYRQNANTGYVSVVVRSAESGKEYTVSKHWLPEQKSVIRPWLTFIAQVNDSIPIVQEEDFYLEFHGLNATWVNDLTLDTVKCSAVVEDPCSNSVRCANGGCVPPELLCDGINDCGDWSDEVGCPSHCGNVADYFETSASFEGMHKLDEDTCIHRIHGQPGKHTLLTIGAVTNTGLPSFHIVMKLYKGFMERYSGERLPGSGYFPVGSLVFTTDKFPKTTSYLIESHNITIIMEYSSVTLAPVRLSYEMVEEGHCSLVCPNHHCLFNNRRCDGKLGCSDGSDEKDCARVVEKDNMKVLEVKHLDGPYAPICADDMSARLADVVCKQLGDLYAERPLNRTLLPPAYDGITPHKLIDNMTVSDHSMIQAFISVQDDAFKVGNADVLEQPKKTAGQCSSRETWVPKCISYQCGVRPIDINPFDPSMPALHPILRIIGGRRAKKGRWPWIASLLLKERDHNCGATLISDRFVVTAAHCFDEHSPELFTVLLGASSIKNYGPQTSLHRVKRGIIHNAYNKQADIPDWDIALVELEPRVRFTTYISPICLPEGGMEFPPGTECYITGFGHISEGRGSQNTLNEAKTPILSNFQCDANMYRGSISERMLCAGYPDTGGVGICHGDSGGPLMCQQNDKGSWYLVGVTSWSIGCANKLKPDVFTRILSHVGWLNEHTGFNLSLPEQSKPVQGTCGGTFYGSESGAFASPGWPGVYKNNTECVYRIFADLGQTIHLTFDEFATEMFFDIVEVFSGDLSMASRIKAQHSGTAKPGPFSVRSSALYVVFISDSDTQERGFLARWRITGAPVKFTGPTHPLQVQLRSSYPPAIRDLAHPQLGYFFFENIGPGGWPTYEQYVADESDPLIVAHKLEYIPQTGHWTIRPKDKEHEYNATVGMRAQCVKVTPDLCNSSWQLWNGTRWIEILLKPTVMIGLTTPKPKTLNPTTVPTTTPDPATTAASPITCGGVLTSRNGVLSLPGYGSRNYSHNMHCKWYINPPPSAASVNISKSDKKRWIQLEIVDFETQEDHDYLKGYPGNKTDQSATLLFGLSGVGFHLDGPSSPELVISPLDTEVETREEAEPWFSVLGGLGMQLSTASILPTTETATQPITTESVQNNNSSSGGKQNLIIPVLNYEDTNSGGMTLVFNSDSSFSNKGFLIQYYVLDDLSESPLTSIKYVTIDLTAGSGVNDLFRRKREIEASDWKDDLGSGDYEFPFGSGDDYGEYYYPDYLYQSDFVNPNCNFTIEFNSTGAKNINYTSDFDAGTYSTLYCIWRIKTKYPVQLIDLDLILDGYTGTVDSYMFQIIDQLDIELFLQDTVPATQLQKSIRAFEYAEIHFRTNIKGIGFNANLAVYDMGGDKSTTKSMVKVSTTVASSTPSPSATTQLSTTAAASPQAQSKQSIQVTSNCENVIKTIDGDSLYIFSPNFPDNYPGNTACTWIMKAPSTHQIQITFTHMKIEEVSEECSYDNVTIIDGEMDSKPLHVYCGTELPGRTRSSGSVMVVNFTSDRLVQDQGFQAIVTSVKSVPKSAEKTDNVLFYCDFDGEHICDFRHDKSSDVDFTWTKHFSVTPSENTGPPHDASENGDGYYLFIEASMPRTPGDRARIVSPVIESHSNGPMCLSFAYSMRGLSVGSLIVYASIASDGAVVINRKDNREISLEEEERQQENLYNLRPIVLNFGAGLDQNKMIPTYRNSTRKPAWQQFLLWSETGEQEDDKPWLTAQVTFTPNNHFQLLFEGIRGSEYQSDIAIDNIVVVKGECEKKKCNNDEIECTGGENKKKMCIPKALECDGHKDCESGSDESRCSSPLQQTCNRMRLTPNTTEWMICNNIEKCEVRSSIGRISDIACNGIYDCFGGFDEAYCDGKKGLGNKINKGVDCGRQKVEDKEIVNRSHVHQISSDVMPWVAGLYLQVNDEASDRSRRFLFLCSAVFIKDSWLLAPAHCILDPEMTRKELDDFIHRREAVIPEEGKREPEELPRRNEPLNTMSGNDVPWLSELSPLSEFQDFFPDDGSADDTIDQSQTTFDYYIMTHPPSSDQSNEDVPGKEKTIFKVSKLVPHPNYAIFKQDDSQECNISIPDEIINANEKEKQEIKKDIKCDINRINHDVALIKVEKILSKTELEKNLESEDRKKVLSDPKKPGILQPTSDFACLNKKISQNSWRNGDLDLETSSQMNNIFFPPSEKNAFDEEYKKKATCYAVGFSNVQQTVEQKYPVALSRKSVRLVTTDLSARRLICGMRNKFKPMQDCLELFKQEKDLHPLIVSGYREIKEAAFLHDQGPVLMCQGWDERWYLTGLYSWSNMYKNLQHDRLYEDIEGVMNGGLLEHNKIIGMPLGVNVYMDVTRISSWVEDTLQDDCPGEFPCYDSSSSYPQKCIPKQKLCDGVIDCPINFLDEINCASGCLYDEEMDPFAQYYQNLDDFGVELPENIILRYDLEEGNETIVGNFDEIEEKAPMSNIMSSEEGTGLRNLTLLSGSERSWRNEMKHGKIRVNKVKDNKIKMCIWTIKAPEDKVTVLHVEHFNTVLGGNKIQIISSGNGQKEILKTNLKDVYYTSEPGGTLTVRILPPSTQLYLTDIKYFEASHRTENVGICQDQHKCGDGKCVSPHRVCDGIWDCSDRSDEANCESGCGGLSLISGLSSGEISSKNYPLPHYGNGDCEWQFVASQDGEAVPMMNFEFLDFQTDIRDILFLFKGAGMKKTGKHLLAIYHGERGPFNIKIKAREATFILRSNDFIGKRRFKMRYTVTRSQNSPA